MKSRIWLVFCALLVAASPVLLTATPASAASAGTGVCGDPAPAALLHGQKAAGLTQPDSQVVAATADDKAQHDTEAAAVRAAALKWPGDDARKRTMVAAVLASQPSSATAPSSPDQVRRCDSSQTVSPNSYTSGSGYAWVNNLQQQGQQRSYWCGPATVSEMAWTVPGPSNVNQANAASYMGTNTDGTNVDAMTNGLVHFVGIPDYGWNFYSFVWMDYSPTQSQRSTFLGNLQTDVVLSSPVAGDAWETVNGPHLLNHPNQRIFHWFEIGGWNTNSSQVYYADSATTVWAAVQPYNWQDMYTVETILGGRGYVW
jgi:hypothetical protein